MGQAIKSGQYEGLDMTDGKAKAGERTIYGAIWTAQGAAAYNAMSAKIRQLEAQGKEVPEHLLNGRFNIYVSNTRPSA